VLEQLRPTPHRIVGKVETVHLGTFAEGRHETPSTRIRNLILSQIQRLQTRRGLDVFRKRGGANVGDGVCGEVECDEVAADEAGDHGCARVVNAVGGKAQNAERFGGCVAGEGCGDGGGADTSNRIVGEIKST